MVVDVVVVLCGLLTCLGDSRMGSLFVGLQNNYGIIRTVNYVGTTRSATEVLWSEDSFLC